MVKDLTPKKKSQKELILAAIELLKVKGFDINPYTVADEAGIARSALYRSTEYMDLLKESRNEVVDGKDTSTRSLHDRIHEMTERARELEETIWNLEAENEKLTKEKQEAWNEGFQAGRDDTVRRLAASREAELQLEANLLATTVSEPPGQNETSPLTPLLEPQVEAAAAIQPTATAEQVLPAQSEPIDMSPADEPTETADPNQFQTGEIKVVTNPLQAPGAFASGDRGETPFQASHTPQDDRISAMAMQQLAREPASATNPIITAVTPTAPEGVFNAARSGPRVASNFNPLVELSWRDVETVYNYEADSLKGIANQIPAPASQEPVPPPSPEPDTSPVGWQDPSSAQILPPEPPQGAPSGPAGKKASPQAVEAYKQFAYNNYGTDEDGGEAIFSGVEAGSRISDPLFPSDESLTRFEPELEPTFEQTAKWEQPSQIPIEAQSHEAIQGAGGAPATEQPEMRLLDAAAQAALSPEALQHYQVWANQHQPQYRETTSYRTGEHQPFDQSAYSPPKKQSYLDLGEPEEGEQAPQSNVPTGEQLHQEVHAGAFQGAGASAPPPPPYGQDPYGNASQQAHGQDPYSSSNAVNQDPYQTQGYAAANSQQYQYGAQQAAPTAQEPPYDPYQAYDPYQQQGFDENEARTRGRKTGDKLQAFGDPRDLSNSDPVVDLDALDIFDDLDDYMDVDKIDVIPDVESGQPEEEEELKTAGDELRELIKGRIKQAADIPADAAQRLTGSHAGGANAEKPVGGMGARNKFVGGKAQQTTMEPGANPPTTAPAGFMPKMPPEMRKHLLILGLSVDPESLTKEKVLVAWKNQIAYAHPDLGGDTESAVALNAAKEALVKWVEAQGPKLGKKFGKPGPQGGTMPPQGGTMPPQNPS